MDALLAHPSALLLLSWTVSRLQILMEVRTRMGADWHGGVYLRRRWPQIAYSALLTLLAYGIAVGLGAPAWLVSAAPLNPPLTDAQALAALAAGSGLAADQVIERVTSLFARRRHEAQVGEDEDGDITRIVADLRGDDTARRP